MIATGLEWVLGHRCGPSALPPSPHPTRPFVVAPSTVAGIDIRPETADEVLHLNLEPSQRLLCYLVGVTHSHVTVMPPFLPFVYPLSYMLLPSNTPAPRQ